MSKTAETATAAPLVINVCELPQTAHLVGFSGVPAVSVDRLDALFSYEDISRLTESLGNAVRHYIGLSVAHDEVSEDNIEVLTNLHVWLAGIMGDALQYIVNQNNKND